jgi:2-polyprenyl-3-methyl-5-hydroxy-6-metoxy-1,4-benzoquinol methylase
MCDTDATNQVTEQSIVDEVLVIGKSILPLHGKHYVAICENCNLTYQRERFFDEDLKTYYKEGYYLSAQKNKVDLEERRERSIPFNTYLKGLLEEQRINIDSHLDFGCAQGNLLLMLGANGVGVEIVPEYVEYARDHGLEIYETLEEVSGPFDLVSLVEVLEHMPYPAELLKNLHEKIKVGGHLLVTVPNLEGGHPHPISNRHLIAFSPLALANALEWSGFELVYTAQTSGAIKSLVYIGVKK